MMAYDKNKFLEIIIKETDYFEFDNKFKKF